MQKAVSLDGIVPVIPTPFHADETIDEDSFRKAVEFVVSREVAALCLPAYGSEFYKLTDNEREAVVGMAIEVAGGRVPVVAQVAAALARRYEQMGASLISLLANSALGALCRDLTNAREFLEKHADRLLFGRDCYGGDLQSFLASLDLPAEVSSKIFCDNAEQLVPVEDVLQP